MPGEQVLALRVALTVGKEVELKEDHISRC